MKYEDVVWFSDNGREISEDLVLSKFNDQIAVGNKIALPLQGVSTIYANQPEVEVKDRSGNLLGVLCLCKGKNIDLSKMTEVQNVCYFSEIEKEYYGQPYQFQKDYFVLDINDFENYKQNYLSTSFLWGGYVHLEHGTKQPYAQTTSLITAIPDIEFPTSYHIEIGVRGVFQPFTFERYLKFYHLLELLFDYDTVERIKNLGNDLKGIGQIFATYEKNETDRLRYVLENRCSDFDAIAQKLNAAFSSSDFLNKAKTIFFEFGKGSYPLKDEQKFADLVSRGGFTEANSGYAGFSSNRKQYEKIILDVVVYWLYRIRCSIAHSRIGEYVMTMDDEEFVIEFAEPLIKEALIQAFKK